MNAFAVIERTVSNVEAEIAVISAMLCEPRVAEQLADTLDESDFAEQFLGFVYGTIVREASLGRHLNIVTIRPFLDGQEAFKQLGGMAWLADLGAHSVTILAAKESARQVRDLAKRRRLIDGLRATIAAAGECGQSVESLIEQADEALNDARDGETSKGEHSAADCARMVIDGFDRPVTGVTCGNILSIDQLLGPLRPSQLIIGAGRPGMGKTATAVSYALGAAQNGHGVLFVSEEMGAEELGERMIADLCLESRVLYSKIRDRQLSMEERRHVCRAASRLGELPLQIVDKPGLTIPQLRTIVKRWQRRYEARGQKLELLIVDYLQLLRAPGDRYEAVTEISRSLKEIAKEFDLAVFALAQLSRNVEQRADKRPMLSDLRDSGQIEQDADAVLFFLRDEYYLRNAEPQPGTEAHDKWEEALQASLGRIEFICAKRRNGETGSLKGDFLYHFQAVRG